jgi:hypothetical protein
MQQKSLMFAEVLISIKNLMTVEENMGMMKTLLRLILGISLVS